MYYEQGGEFLELANLLLFANQLKYVPLRSQSIRLSMTSKAAKAKGAERKQRMDTSSLMEQILSKDNLKAVYLQVVRNKGAAGVDGMAVEELGAYLSENGENIREQLRTRKYKLQPVRRVEILVHMPLFNVGNLLYRYMAQI